MKEYTELKERISKIIEKSNNDKPACKNCEKYVDGGCSLGCVNERNGHKYHFNNIKITTPEYACDYFRPVYNLSENTKDTLRNLIEDIDRVNEGITNLDLLLDGKINEDEFNEILK